MTKRFELDICGPLFNDTKIDAEQPEKNWNNGKIKGYDLGVST